MCPCGTTVHLHTDEVMAAVEALDEALSRIVRPASEGASGIACGLIPGRDRRPRRHFHLMLGNGWSW
jgi:hypothetical protein